MKITTNKKELLEVLKAVLPASNDKSMLPSHGCFLLSAKEDIMYVFAADQHMSILYSVLCKTAATGDLGVSAKLLTEAVSNIQGDDIALKYDGSRLQVIGKKAALKLPVLSAEQMMVPPNYPNHIYMPAPDFFKNYERVAYATAQDETNRHFNAVQMTSGMLVATDRHRLAMLEYKSSTDKQLLLPPTSVMKLKKAFDQVSIAVDGSRVLFMSGTKYASITMLEGKYPDLTRLIPKGPCMEVTVNISDLKEALKLVEVTADKKLFSVLFSFKEGTMIVSSASESGDAVQEITAQLSAIPDQPICFGGKFILQTLDNLTLDQVTMEIRGSNQPLIIKEGGYINVIMPRRP